MSFSEHIRDMLWGHGQESSMDNEISENHPEFPDKIIQMNALLDQYRESEDDALIVPMLKLDYELEQYYEEHRIQKMRKSLLSAENRFASRFGVTRQ